jgi:hypothetical protein
MWQDAVNVTDKPNKRNYLTFHKIYNFVGIKIKETLSENLKKSWMEEVGNAMLCHILLVTQNEAFPDWLHK